MRIKRVIPCLLLRNNGLVKTIRFKESVYIGDPINAVRIFNEKEVDELVFLDIDATRNRKDPSFGLIRNIATECFMPFSYGGGIESLQQIEEIIKSGAEKIIINTQAFLKQNFISEAVARFGSSTIVVSMDVKKKFIEGYLVYVNGGRQNTGIKPVDYARQMEDQGAGEIFITSIDRDGMMEGYDLELIKSVTEAVTVPVIACGGAGNLNDLGLAVKEGGASAVAAGSLFVFQGKRRAVLITYPSYNEISNIFN
ncbi:MAG: AglZ/HisF2 family acetamidino modification protein [Bacteroidales bacterium]|jgi:cyclase|nr:AglZ/HisF2 family acetamidino modification protein [Bacteroidales bacterium]